MRPLGSRIQAWKLSPGASLLAFGVMGWLAYRHALYTSFLSDDFLLLQELGKGASSALTAYGPQFWRPVASLSLFADLLIWEHSPAGFHATSLALHILNALLVMLVTQRLVAPGLELRPSAVLAGLTFLLHPSHSEAVVWIASRSDLLAALFSLTGLLVLMRSVESDRGGRWMMWVGLLGALAAKESTATMSWVLLIWLRYSRRDDWQRGTLVWLLAIAPVAWVVVRSAFIGSLVGGYGSEIHLALAPRQLAGPALSYLLRGFLPPLSPEHAAAALSTVLIVVLACASLLAGRPTTERAGASRSLPAQLTLQGVSYIIACIPVANLGTSLFDSQGERLLYLPTVFSSIGLAILCDAAFRARRGGWVLQGAFLVFMALSTIQSSRTWQEAGVASRLLLQSVAELGTETRVLLANLPDNLRGAYVFRNGFEAACELVGARAPLPLVGTAPVRADEIVEARRDGDVVRISISGGRSVRPAILPSHRSSFVLLPGARSPSVLVQTSHELELRLPTQLRAAPLYAFSGGRLEPGAMR